jgi:hypothetical protein
MSKAPSPTDSRGEDRIERLQHWTAVLLSALLHLLLLLLAMLLSPPITMSSPQGTAGGSRMAVDFIGDTPPQPTDVPPAVTPAPRKPAAKPRAASRVQSTLVTRADDPVPYVVPDEVAQDSAQAPAASAPTAPATPPRRPHIWGQPPGMLPEETAPENAGLARSPATGRGRGNDASAAVASLEVGGYQVYYDLRAEARLRAWRDKGMTEIFLLLPGTRRYMACPLETALRRESGPCRLLEPDSPELAAIGDAREVIDMQRVYRQGEVVWDGPGPYR